LLLTVISNRAADWLKVGAEKVGTQMRLIDLRLGFTPQDAKNPEVLKQAHTIEFANRAEVERGPLNHEVIKAVQLLKNVRARNEALKRMDHGDYDEARVIIGSSLAATRV